MDPDAESQEAADLLAVGRVEAEVAQLGADRLAFVARGHPHAGERLRELGALALGEVDHVDRRAVGLEQVLDRLVERRLLVLEVERHRTHDRGHVGDRDAGGAFEALGDRRHVAQSRRHEEKARLRERDERHLPGPAALVIGVVVELVEHGVRGVEQVAGAQRHVGEHLRSAAEDLGLGIDRGVAGQHADVRRAEVVAKGEELLRGECLDRAGVVGDLALGERLEVHPERHHRLAGAGRGVEDHVLAGEDLEQRLLLVGIEGEPGIGRPGDEAVEELLRGGAGMRGEALGQKGSDGHGTILSPPPLPGRSAPRSGRRIRIQQQIRQRRSGGERR